MTKPGWTHLDESGAASMVDIGDKPISKRRAKASAVCVMKPETATAIQERQGPKEMYCRSRG